MIIFARIEKKNFYLIILKLQENCFSECGSFYKAGFEFRRAGNKTVLRPSIICNLIHLLFRHKMIWIAQGKLILIMHISKKAVYFLYKKKTEKDIYNKWKSFLIMTLWTSILSLCWTCFLYSFFSDFSIK